MSEVNTVCSTCHFFQDDECYFNILALISKDYKLEKKKDKYVIDNYKCSYAFSKKQFEMHKDNLPDDFIDYVRAKNAVKYYLILNLIDKSIDQMFEIYDKYIDTLSIKPYEISMACKLKKEDILKFIDGMKKRNKISWKSHNFVNQKTDTDENNVFHTITGTNLEADKKGYMCYVSKNFTELQEQVSYANFVATVSKSKNVAGLRESTKDLNGLFIPISTFKEIKSYCEKNNEYYIDTLRNDTEVIHPYYE